MNSRPIILKPWPARFNFHEEVLKTIPIWVQYPNLPLNCWSKRSLSRISSSLGTLLYADDCTSSVHRFSYARVLVEMDITRAVPRSIVVQDPDGEVFEQG